MKLHLQLSFIFAEYDKILFLKACLIQLSGLTLNTDRIFCLKLNLKFKFTAHFNVAGSTRIKCSRRN